MGTLDWFGELHLFSLPFLAVDGVAGGESGHYPMPSKVLGFSTWGLKPLILKDQMGSSLEPGWRCSEQGSGTGHCFEGANPSLDGFSECFAAPATLNPEKYLGVAEWQALEEPRHSVGPETQANCLKNQPATFKGGSGQGQHQIPAVPLSAHRHTAPKLRLKTSTFLDSSLFPATNI